MSYGLISHDTLEDIAAAIRIKANSDRDYYPKDMANAIMQIVTSGEGFNEPICFDYNDYDPSQKGFPPFKTNTVQGVEIITQSELDNAEHPENYHEVFKNIEWTAMSPGKMDLYFYSGQDGIRYYIVLADGSEKRASFLNMSRMFEYSTGITKAIKGTYTHNMYRAYYSCSNLTTAECGPNVENLSYAYYTCTSLTTPKCGEGVKDMSYAYYGCTNLTKAEIGPNVENLYYAYNGCTAINSDITIPEKVNNLYYAFSMNTIITGIAILANNLPDDPNKLASAFGGRYTEGGPYAKRNIVVTHLSTFDIIMKSSNGFFGNTFEWTEETYEEPVKITVDGTEYDTFSCSYNTDINTYVYCTERRLEENLSTDNGDNGGAS